ncbi:MAG: MarP family serine protease [Chloroflexota bacterium]
MNAIDALTLLLIVVALVLGWRSGAIPQVTGLLGAIVGGVGAILALPYLADLLSDLDPTVRPFVVLIGLIGAVAIGESVGAGIGRSVAAKLGPGLLGTADRTAGAGLGVIQVLLIVWLAGSLLAEGPVPRLAEAAGGSTAVRTMAGILPPPTEVAIGLGGWLDTTGLPDVFVGFEPLPAPPVDQPNDPTARAIAAAAQASTFKVTAATCGLSSVGTGFVVASGYILTNAHVVAGAGERGIRVSRGDGDVHDATPVLVDPAFDIALLSVKDLQARALQFARKDPDRGAVGATLGYPGGGRLTVLPAAVSSRYAATGHDIYSRDRVRRQILELRAEVDRGDSGGPLILADGTVGGVVFAEARTDPQVGYALAASEVADHIRLAIGRTAAVDTGECVVDR